MLGWRDGSQRIRAFRRDGYEEPFFGTGQEPLHESLVGVWLKPCESIFTAVEAFDFKLLARFDFIALPKVGGQSNLAVFGDRRFHQGYNNGR